MRVWDSQTADVLLRNYREHSKGNFCFLSASMPKVTSTVPGPSQRSNGNKRRKFCPNPAALKESTLIFSIVPISNLSHFNPSIVLGLHHDIMRMAGYTPIQQRSTHQFEGERCPLARRCREGVDLRETWSVERMYGDSDATGSHESWQVLIDLSIEHQF